MHAALQIRRRTTTLVALLLFVLATLAPGVSRALSHVQGQVAPWAQICSTATPAQTPDGGDLAVHLMDHCPLCGLQADNPASPPVPSAAFVSLALSQAVPALFLAAPRPLHAWAAHAPRGPPSLV